MDERKFHISVGGEVNGPIVVGDGNVQHNVFPSKPDVKSATIGQMNFCPIDGEALNKATFFPTCRHGMFHVVNGWVVWQNNS